MIVIKDNNGKKTDNNDNEEYNYKDNTDNNTNTNTRNSVNKAYDGVAYSNIPTERGYNSRKLHHKPNYYEISQQHCEEHTQYILPLRYDFS